VNKIFFLFTMTKCVPKPYLVCCQRVVCFLRNFKMFNSVRFRTILFDFAHILFISLLFHNSFRPSRGVLHTPSLVFLFVFFGRNFWAYSNAPTSRLYAFVLTLNSTPPFFLSLPVFRVLRFAKQLVRDR